MNITMIKKILDLLESGSSVVEVWIEINNKIEVEKREKLKGFIVSLDLARKGIIL